MKSKSVTIQVKLADMNHKVVRSFGFEGEFIKVRPSSIVFRLNVSELIVYFFLFLNVCDKVVESSPQKLPLVVLPLYDRSTFLVIFLLLAANNRLFALFSYLYAKSGILCFLLHCKAKILTHYSRSLLT